MEKKEKIEKAKKFLIASFKKSGKNTKPTIRHSLEVGRYLEKAGYGIEVVIAGLLHDLLEDTDVTKQEIERRFGKKVLHLVEANSFDESITDKTERYKELFERCAKAGKDALVIKTADILENHKYMYLVTDKKLYNELHEKWKYFLEVARSKIGNEKVFQELEKELLRTSSINWQQIREDFELEMARKLQGLPDHRDIPVFLKELRQIISHELPETTGLDIYQKLIKMLLSGKPIDIDKIRVQYLNPEVKKEQSKLKMYEPENEQAKKDALIWIKRNFSEILLNKLWLEHKTWLLRRYTIYPIKPSFQQIAADTLARY